MNEINTLPRVMQAELLASAREGQAERFEKLAGEAEAHLLDGDRIAAAEARAIMADARVKFAQTRVEEATKQIERTRK